MIREQHAINTTGSVRGVPRGVVEGVEDEATYQARVNTTAVYDNAEALDEEPEIISVMPGTGWAARFEDGHTEPLVAFVAWDDASMSGVVVAEDGRINLEDSVEGKEGFINYERISD